MNRLLWPITVCMLISLCALSGCGGTSIRHIQASATSTTLLAQASPTVVTLSVELGTGLAGSVPNVAIINPTTNFTANDTFAFVIHLRAPINASKVACLIYDPDYNIAWQWDLTTEPGAMVLASSTPKLGTVLEKYTSNSVLQAPVITPPLGTYVLQVEPYPSSPINYADNATFVYKG